MRAWTLHRPQKRTGWRKRRRPWRNYFLWWRSLFTRKANCKWVCKTCLFNLFKLFTDFPHIYLSTRIILGKWIYIFRFILGFFELLSREENFMDLSFMVHYFLPSCVSEPVPDALVNISEKIENLILYRFVFKLVCRTYIYETNF